MRYYKSFILFSLLALVFVACDTDDLEKDIDALKDRVASVEAQVQRLNDEMNILRVALDGNKTITNYSINGDTYTLTLSNGETLTLTQGEVGDNYPSIDISEDGYWVIAGNKTEWRAKAKDGEDATITPQFKIDKNPDADGKKYWWVSYDGSTWKVLENGLAEGENNNPPLINKVEVKDGYFNVTIGDQVYQIPVVEGLECAINAEGLVDGLWTIAGGVEASFSVKVNLADGDLVRVNAPADWNAKVSEYSAGATDVIITLIPPITPSECIIVVEVTRGVNTASDQIKAKTISDSYWAEYQAGFDIKIGDVVINKFDYPNAKLLQDGETVPATGVYFIADGATVKKSGPVTDLVLIAEKKDNKYSSKISTTGNISLGNLAEGIGFLCKGVALSSEGTSNVYWFNLSGNIIERLYFDHCRIEFMIDKNFSNFDKTGSGIKNLLIESCHIAVPAQQATEERTVLFLRYGQGQYGNMTIRNNVFYCTTENKAVSLAPLMTTNKATVLEGINVCIENNTLINALLNHDNSTSGFMKIPYRKGWKMKNNLVWYDVALIANKNATASFLSELGNMETFDIEDLSNNKVFTTVEDNPLTWGIFRDNKVFEDNVIIPELTTPFVDGTLVDTEGKYTLKPEYQGIGAIIE
ncbi:PL29 family lyase N-terminal domain-containing protein [Bacteroides zhangwenhongii]|jgi:hypothetical protein|uniref:PL29 family lyase N-terminal domain-containing protein n=1 Tax=Bacteroides zhangwenhongii TaxID=2650157 RepID=UPI0032C0D85F